MASTEYSSSHIPEVAAIESQARALQPDEARQMIVQEIFDMADAYNENLAGSTSEEALRAAEHLAALWIAYANMEAGWKQWKKAVQVFDDALADPIVSERAEIYRAYADFCRSRGKQANALKIYLRGMKAPLSDEQYDRLWVEFAVFMNTAGDERTPLNDLITAVEGQVEGGLRRPGPSVEAAVTQRLDGLLVAAPAATAATAEPGTEGHQLATVLTAGADSAAPQSTPSTTLSTTTSTSTIAAVTPPRDDRLPRVRVVPSGRMDDFASDVLPPIDPRELMNVHSRKPFSIFTVPSEDPLLSGLEYLSATDVRRVEEFLHLPEGSAFDPRPRDCFAERVLDLLEGMWAEQAFKERCFEKWFAALMQQHANESYGGPEMLRDPSVRENHRLEYMLLKQRHNFQMEVLSALSNKVRFELLRDQEQVLHAINFPYFDNIPNSVLTPGALIEPDIDTLFCQRAVVCAALALRIQPPPAPGSSSYHRGGLRITSADSSPDGGVDENGDKRRKRKTRMRFSDADGPDAPTESMDDVELKRQRDGEGRARPSRFSDATATPASGAPPQVVPLQQQSQHQHQQAPSDPRAALMASAATAAPAASAAPAPVKSEPEKPINPAAIPLLQQLAMMLKKGKK